MPGPRLQSQELDLGAHRAAECCWGWDAFLRRGWDCGPGSISCSIQKCAKLPPNAWSVLPQASPLAPQPHAWWCLKWTQRTQEVQGRGARRVFMGCRARYKPHRWWLYVHADDRMWYVGPTVEIRALAVGYAATPSWWNTHKLGKLSAEAAERERAWCLLLKCYYFQDDPIDSRDVATD